MPESRTGPTPRPARRLWVQLGAYKWQRWPKTRRLAHWARWIAHDPYNPGLHGLWALAHYPGSGRESESGEEVSSAMNHPVARMTGSALLHPSTAPRQRAPRPNTAPGRNRRRGRNTGAD